MNNDPVFIRIDELRKQQKVTQTELINQLGMARGTYFHWKSGNSLSYYAHISDISKILSVPSGYLIDGAISISQEAHSSVPLLDDKELVQLFHKLDSDNQKAFITILRSLCLTREKL